MLFLRAEDLELQGIPCQETGQLVLHNTLFTAAQSFSPKGRQAAVQMCQKYLKADIVCLIVESPEKITLWRENKNHQSKANSLCHKREQATTGSNQRRAFSGRSRSRRKSATALHAQ
ncbi:hypothetical protein [Phormidium sp. CCY1219]|jgi:hypothetical protein|uniref:hypothetical protein n=1 Tax=Phormidium sp. CCY1219 TaxID=2886104 RepID=UPI002D1EE020|nr:hypothetical protein [Phormidium sp. CCY1219]MEB3827521.1 hypothetical protein [Phormidium sp. CCY1219]